MVSFNGDGCFLMCGQELATAVRHQANVVFVVIDNGSYGTIRMHQERHYPGRPVGTELANPDFVAFARSFGLSACSVTDADRADRRGYRRRLGRPPDARARAAVPRAAEAAAGLTRPATARPPQTLRVRRAAAPGRDRTQRADATNSVPTRRPSSPSSCTASRTPG